ncbi:hypothetical protein [Aerosakkonema funiforme]|uniref:hypothetical protein n=1 Tax=Aerosakkonema funiforme TaxID=1246630 RepID=UPI001683D93D|nr:hypothetical protein [Aerosakkonema funiforme]
MYISHTQNLKLTELHLSDEQFGYFTVYENDNEIVLRPGCQNYTKNRAIGSYRYYENAYEVAVELANYKRIPFKDYVFWSY